jgi:hypothetical protein
MAIIQAIADGERDPKRNVKVDNQKGVRTRIKSR